jgi:hypothetical protein
MSEVVELPKRKNAGGTVETPTFQAIVGWIKDALEDPDHDPVLIIGAPGVGKSEALKSLVSPRRFRLEMNPTFADKRRGLRRGLDLLGRTVGVHVDFYQRTADMDRAIRRRFRDMGDVLGDGPLVMWDECQHMCDELIEYQKSLMDDANITMVFAGNRQFYNHLTEEKFASVFDRFGRRKFIDEVKPADVSAFCGAHGISGAREHAFLLKIADQGALRDVNKVIKEARKLAGNEIIRFHHLADAAEDLDRMPPS